MLIPSPMLVLIMLPILGSHYRNGYEQVTLIDTGSTLSLCSLEFAKNYKSISIKNPIAIKGIGGDESLSSYINIMVNLEGRIISHRVFPAPTVDRPLILGNDFLIKEPCHINYVDKKVRIGEATFRLYLNNKEIHDDRCSQELHTISTSYPCSLEESSTTIKVKAAESLTLSGPGYHSLGVKFNMANCPNPVTNYIFEWDDTFLSTHPVIGPNFATTPETLDRLILSSIGPLIEIHKNMTVGVLSPIASAYFVNSTVSPQTTEASVNGRPTQMTKEQMNLLHLAPDLSTKEKKDLLALLSQYADVFTWDSEGLSDLGCLKFPWEDGGDGVRLHLKPDPPPIFQKPYKMSMHEREFTRAYVEKLEKAGLISSKVCGTTSPMLLVKKANGKLRLVVDLRKVNTQALHDCQQVLPEIEEIFSLLSQFTHLTTTDLASGYWQIPIDSRDKHVTGTIHLDGSFYWDRLVQGLATSPFIFQNLMRQVFHQQLFKSLFAYLDDLIIFSNSFSDHLHHLHEFFNRLRQVNLTLAYDKCHIAMGEARVLGFVLKRGGECKPDPKKTEAISNMPPPLDSDGRVNLTKSVVSWEPFHSTGDLFQI